VLGTDLEICAEHISRFSCDANPGVIGRVSTKTLGCEVCGNGRFEEG
jgi:hypothetical protein